MQPYFFPYAGYYRLLNAVDEFVLFDCVQFPRRGRVHQTESIGTSGQAGWLTLPLARQPRSTLIEELEFPADARARLDERLARLPWLRQLDTLAARRLRRYLSAELGGVVDFLEEGLRLSAEVLGIEVAISRSSELDLGPSIRGQDRVIEVALARGARTYVNLPGGRHLYSRDRFSDRGLNLAFMPTYEGPYRHMLQDLMTKRTGTHLERRTT